MVDDGDGWWVLLTDLDDKGGKGKRIRVQHDAADVADDLVDAPDQHADHEAPGFPSDPLDEVDEHEQPEHADDDGVARDRGLVLQDAGLERAELQGAVGTGAEADEAVGESCHREGVEGGVAVCRHKMEQNKLKFETKERIVWGTIGKETQRNENTMERTKQ